MPIYNVKILSSGAHFYPESSGAEARLIRALVVRYRMPSETQFE